MTSLDEVVAALRAVRLGGTGGILTGADSLPYARDRSGHLPGIVDFAVALPVSIDEVREVVRQAHQHKVPLIARGAGSGYAGGAVATDGALVLSFERMNRILRLDPQSQVCVVEAGVITAEISKAAAPFGLRYAPDPASVAISTIGGNIATNAGGLCCVKYGVTRDSVLALDVVLADGRLIHTGHESIKGVSGYDLTALMVGSEGTLGIVVGATLRLLPIPLGHSHTLCAFFPSAEDATAASVDLLATGVRPAMLELVDEVHLERIDEWRDTRFRERGGGMLLVQTDGLAAEEEGRILAAALHAAGGDVEVTADRARAEQLLDVRRWTSQESAPRAEVTLNEDIAVPRRNLTEMVASVRAIREEHGVSVTLLAHIGDGNLHANVRIPNADLAADGQLPPSAWAAADALVTRALELGGTITGEHGIGLLKRRWLREELGDDQYELQRGLRSFFDPEGTLNPDKVFPCAD
jgi:glycolate oxidase